MNEAVTQLDEMTQQNAALVEEAAAASQAMGEQARDLNEQVSFFMTTDTAAAAPRIERRAANRPWQDMKTDDNEAAEKSEPVVQPRRSTVNSSEDDSEWEEF